MAKAKRHRWGEKQYGHRAAYGIQKWLRQCEDCSAIKWGDGTYTRPDGAWARFWAKGNAAYRYLQADAMLKARAK